MKFQKLIIFAFGFVLFGCSAGQMKNVEQAGFLQDYSKLQEGTEDQSLQVYINQDVDFKSYDKIMFERVTVWLSDSADYRGIDPDELKMLADHFQKALIDAMEDGYQIVDQPGRDVLQVRVAITNLKPSKPVANTISTILPIGWAVSGAAKIVSGDNLGTGEAAAEFEVLDSTTGRQLAAAVDNRQGGKTVFRGKWADSKEALEYWANKFRKRLDELRGVAM